MSEKGTLGHVRVEALSDGIFAFAMVLLAVDIKPPESFEQLHGVCPQVLSFVVSFVNLGLYWVAHNNEAKEVERTCRGMLWINLLFLMLVVLVPFSTALVSKHYEQPGAIRIYACNVIAVGLALEFLWVYDKNKLNLLCLCAIAWEVLSGLCASKHTKGLSESVENSSEQPAE